jgi:hypothetical protein
MLSRSFIAGAEGPSWKYSPSSSPGSNTERLLHLPPVGGSFRYRRLRDHATLVGIVISFGSTYKDLIACLHLVIQSRH